MQNNQQKERIKSILSNIDVDLSDYGVDFKNEVEKLLSKNSNANDISVNSFYDMFGYNPLNVQVRWLSELFANMLYANSSLEFINALNEFKNTKTRLFLGARYCGKSDVLIYGVVVLICKAFKLGIYDIAIAITCATYEKARLIYNKILKEVEFVLPNNAITYDKNVLNIGFNQSKNKFPALTCMSASSKSLRGFHCDIMFFDDLVTDDAETSQALRNLGINKYNEALNVATSLVLIGQPVHEYDIYNIIKQAHNEANNNILLFEYFVGSDLELDNYLLPLIAKNSSAGTSARDIQKNFYGNLIIDASYPFSSMRTENFTFNCKTIASLDPAYDGSDAIGFSIGYIENNKIYALAIKVEVKLKDGNISSSVYDSDVIDVIQSILNECNVSMLYIEANDNGGAFRHLNNKLLNIPCIGYKEKTTTKKDVKIVARIAPEIENLVLHSNSDMQDILMYNKHAKHDDVVDALSSLINFLNGNPDRLSLVY